MERLVRFTAGRSFDEYGQDELLRADVERQFEIIGEALTQLRNGDPETAERVPDLRRIVAFRNILAHGYAKAARPASVAPSAGCSAERDSRSCRAYMAIR